MNDNSNALTAACAPDEMVVGGFCSPAGGGGSAQSTTLQPDGSVACFPTGDNTNTVKFRMVISCAKPGG